MKSFGLRADRLPSPQWGRGALPNF